MALIAFFVSASASPSPRIQLHLPIINAVPSQAPQCTFDPAPGALFIFGAKQLRRYGPMGFEVMYAVAAGLGGEFLQVCKVRQVKQVHVILITELVR
jgi:hypothetical protein